MTFRCKVRKPDGSIVDGCGFEFTPTIDGPLRFTDAACPHCKHGFLREKVSILPGDKFTLTRETEKGRLMPGVMSTGGVGGVGGHVSDLRRVGKATELGLRYEPKGSHFTPAEVMALAQKRVGEHMSQRLGAPEAVGADRRRVLGAVHARVKALGIVSVITTEGPTESEAASVRECIALLKSLLPPVPGADAQAQRDMAAEHNRAADVREASTVGGRGCLTLTCPACATRLTYVPPSGGK